MSRKSTNKTLNHTEDCSLEDFVQNTKTIRTFISRAVEGIFDRQCPSKHLRGNEKHNIVLLPYKVGKVRNGRGVPFCFVSWEGFNLKDGKNSGVIK